MNPAGEAAQAVHVGPDAETAFSLELSDDQRDIRRDAKIYTIFEGTSEIQRLVIARAISGMQIR